MVFDLSTVGKPIDERYASDMAVAAIDLMQGQRTDWIPRNASPEVVLVEALSLGAAQVAGAANEAVGVLAEVLLSDFFGVPRAPGASAVGSLRLTFDSPVSMTLPAGSAFALRDFGVEVSTTTETVLAGVSEATVQVATAVATSLVNGADETSAVDVLDVVPNLLLVEVATPFVGGADPEGDYEYLARARLRLARVTNSLVVPSHFSAFVLEDGQAVNALTIGAWDGVSLATAGTDAGDVTVVCFGRGGNLPEPVREALAVQMTAITAEGITVHVNAADVITVPVAVSVKGMAGYSAAEVTAAVDDATRTFLSGESWVIGADVVRGQLQDRITSLPSVDYVVSLTAPAADVTIPADGVAVAGAISVSVS